jgi:arabinose-5-phosphate isomerase
MNSVERIIEKGKNVIRIEAEAVAELETRIDKQFARAVEMMYACTGRVVVTGMGKSGIIARKIVATLNSTGTPSLFLHPSDAVHGDLGMVRKEDVVICISKSGDTPELSNLLPIFKQIGVPIISLVGKANSRLAQLSEIILDIGVKEEACPYDLAPTSSTTVTLAFGDALAMALLDKRNFTVEEFALYHPGGNLGKRLLLKVEELMVRGEDVPRVRNDIPVREAILEMTSKRLGATCVVDRTGRLVGIVTDGDLRRMLQTTTDVVHTTAEMMMTKHPKTITRELLAAVALQEMEAHNITQLIVVDEGHRPVGMIHLHELVKAGLGGENQ